MARLPLHSQTDGLYKAHYDTTEAQLTISYGGSKLVLDEDECDKLLRMIECLKASDAYMALAEFFDDAPGFQTVSGRIAQGFMNHSYALTKLVYGY